MRILLVEDEERLSEALEYILKKENYLVDVSSDGLDAQAMAETGIYDLIILDRMLPGKEGVEILKSLRAQKINVPVIFLTAKDAVVSRIEGLDAGADDYLVKPFSKDELLARVRALSRRPENLQTEHKVSVGTVTLDTLKCEVQVAQATIKLSLQETHLLEYLMQGNGRILTKEQILDKVWGFNNDVERSNVELYICYLRKKIDFEKGGIVIKTIRGIGYCLKEVPVCKKD